MGRLVRFFRGLGVAVFLALAAIWFSLFPGDPALYPAKGDGVTIQVIDHGWHTGIVLRQADIRAAAVDIARDDPDAAFRLRWLTTRVPVSEWIELGWGDAAFYQQTPTIADMDVWLGLVALFWPTDAVLQLVPIDGAPEAEFPSSDQIALTLSPEGFRELALRLADTVPEQPGDLLGPSLYGAGAFYAAELDYHLFRTCNHWVSWLLRGAGVPSSGVPGTMSATLMAELKWRGL